MDVRRGNVVLTLVVLAVAATAGTADGRARKHAVPRPDLVVSSGTVHGANARLSGAFVVRNAGSARAAASSAALTYEGAGGSRLVKRFAVRALRPGTSKRVAVDAAIPAGLAPGTHLLRACADAGSAVRERREGNNCRSLGGLFMPKTVVPGGGVSAAPSGAPAPGGTTAAPGPTGTTGGSTSSVPTDPVAYTPDHVFTLTSSAGMYWIDVPSAYDASHKTPATLFVWLHGCGGKSEDDINTVSPGDDQDWISVAPSGAEGGCWDVDHQPATVLATIANVKTHFNVNPRRVVIGGYSSGGDLAYRTAFYNAKTFAGLLAENTSPFRDTGSSQQASLAAAAWKFNVVHLAHTEDDTYPLAGVREETDAMKDAGFPLTRIERPGTHYDDSDADSGTDYDLQTLLLPHLHDGWLAPP
jgi:hypothetical protein